VAPQQTARISAELGLTTVSERGSKEGDSDLGLITALVLACLESLSSRLVSQIETGKGALKESPLSKPRLTL